MKMKNLFIFIVGFLLSITSCYGQLNFNAKRISADTIRGRTSNGLQLPYDWAGGLPGANRTDILVNDTTLSEWIQNTAGGGGPTPFWTLADTSILTTPAVVIDYLTRLWLTSQPDQTAGNQHTLALDPGGTQLYSQEPTPNADLSRFNTSVVQIGMERREGGVTQGIYLGDTHNGIAILDPLEQRGLFYQADYSSNFTDRSLPDWGNVIHANNRTELSDTTKINIPSTNVGDIWANPGFIVGHNVTSNDRVFMAISNDAFFFNPKQIGIISQTPTDTTGVLFDGLNEGSLYGELLKQSPVDPSQVPFNALVSREDVMDFVSGNAANNPPTQAQLTAILGTTVSRDQTVCIFRNTNGNINYLILSTGSSWHYLTFTQAP